MAEAPVQVLLVDDDEDDAVLIRDWLTEIETGRFEVHWAPTYEAALAALAGGAHEVYLVDYRLGEHTGLDVVEQVRARDGQGVVIMLTGLGNRSVDEAALQAGAADYLVKTQLTADGLERSIRYARRQKRVERALEKTREELEERVQERTVALTAANRTLRAEIAERKRTAQKLRESERLATIGATAAQLAHEIGNPLNGMATTVQILERRLRHQPGPVDEVVLAAVQDLGQELARLRTLVQGLRTLARPRQLELQPTDVTAVAAEVVRREAPGYAERQIRVEQTFPAPLPLVLANADELTQVFLNLCTNAAEAMPQGGTLRVCGRAAGAQVEVEISDTGGGIPEGVQIFEPFVTTKAQGTGLGLAIVQQIVAAHGGTLSYTSAAGQGATFTLRLPAVAAGAASAGGS